MQWQMRLRARRPLNTPIHRHVLLTHSAHIAITALDDLQHLFAEFFTGLLNVAAGTHNFPSKPPATLPYRSLNLLNDAKLYTAKARC